MALNSGWITAIIFGTMFFILSVAVLLYFYNSRRRKSVEKFVPPYEKMTDDEFAKFDILHEV